MDIITIGVAAAVAIAAAIGVISVKYLGTNNPVEKASEAVIQAETGISPNLNQVAAEVHITPTEIHIVPTAPAQAPGGSGPGASGPAASCLL